ncbi:MAG: beta-propeller fold lactonase family protein [Pseudomonadales bacterium]|nr:beta-propeller fold lactonase family protein [Pseudomonadales bacterium]
MLGREKIGGNRPNKQVMTNLYLTLLVAFVTLDAEAFFTSDDEINGNGFESATHSKNTALTQDGRFLWVVNPDLDSVTVIRTDINEVISTFEVGDEPRSLAITPSGSQIYVANSAGNSISVISVNKNNVDHFWAVSDEDVGSGGEIITGSEPKALVIDPQGDHVFVANSSQDTISIISTKNNKIVGAMNLRKSICNVGDKNRHFQPMALAITKDSQYLYVTRYLSFTTNEGVQRDDFGKEGIICKLRVVKNRENRVRLYPLATISMKTQITGFKDANNIDTYAFPNQLSRIVIRGDKAYLPNIAASPSGPQSFDTITQSFVNVIDNIGGDEQSIGALNIHLGGRDPELGKQEIYFANPIDIGFSTGEGPGSAYVVSAGSDIVVKLSVDTYGNIDFTQDSDTTRYIDLNDPDNPLTSGNNAGKNPVGIAIATDGSRAYVSNYVSRNVSVIDLNTDEVIKVIRTTELPEAGSLDEVILVGAEMFFSSRGNFVTDDYAYGSSRDRLSEKGRQNCASCHPDGLTDGIVWQFATGPRKTLSINGTFNPHDVNDQKIINASAIFDEVEDADFNTRLVSSKGWLESPLPCIDSPPLTGLLESKVDPDHGLILGDWDEFQVAACVLNQFERPNSNRPQPYVQLPGSDVLVKAHDALIDWQRYAVRTPNRPMMKMELFAVGAPVVGGLNQIKVMRGKRVFKEAGCVTCHRGGKWTASTKDFTSPPDPSEVAKEDASTNVNQFQYLSRFLNDIGSYNLNVIGSGVSIEGYRTIGGVEIDNGGLPALGFDYDGDGKGSGYNISSILGTFHTPPYYHNGACETLLCVLSDKVHRAAGRDSGYDALKRKSKRKQLVEYLKSIDEYTDIL